MPWGAKTFSQRHNHKLKAAAAIEAAEQASAMVRKGVSEKIAIATANKTGDRILRARHKRPKTAAESGVENGGKT
jgi:uncharacterized protein YdaT